MINFIRRSVYLNTCIGCSDMFDDKVRQQPITEQYSFSLTNHISVLIDSDQSQNSI